MYQKSNKGHMDTLSTFHLIYSQAVSPHRNSCGSKSLNVIYLVPLYYPGYSKCFAKYATFKHTVFIKRTLTAIKRPNWMEVFTMHIDCVNI